MVAMNVIPGYTNTRSGVQVADKLISKNGEFLSEDAVFLRQMGIEWVMVEGPYGPADANRYKKIVAEVEAHDLKIFRLANGEYHNMDIITLNLEGRDQKLEEYLGYIRALGEAGVYYSTYAHMANGIWRSGETKKIRGGMNGEGLDLDSANARGHWGSEDYDTVLSHGREYSVEELWDNYEYFISRVARVAEESGVYIGIHPDDPPVLTLAGIPRHIFGTFDGYRKAIEMADSPNIGVCLCCGCWLQGGQDMGVDVYDAIRYFTDIDKLFKLHVRNVTNPMSEGAFAETYPNDGYGDVARIMDILFESGFDGAVINDHLAPMVGGKRVSAAFQTAYLLGLADAGYRRYFEE
ncbi:MAG: mannonate dehydratase [Oscillospiraceae bacterium]|nr:mannonate dehydratase [Oscillospiraceae bacterium]